MPNRRGKRSPEARPVGGPGPLASTVRYEIEAQVIAATLEAVTAAGGEGDELFVAWGADVTCGGATARFTTAIAPRQRCVHTPDGLLVVIDDGALFELNRGLHSAGQVLAGQAHGHPGSAYHSSADDGLAITPFAGSLSLVVPDFARGGRTRMREWRWFRREGNRIWRPFDARLVAIG